MALIDFAWIDTALNTDKGYPVNLLVWLTNPFDSTIDPADPTDIDATRFEACFDMALDDFMGVEGGGIPEDQYYHDRKAMKELTKAYLWELNPAKHSEHFAKGIYAAKNSVLRKVDRGPTTPDGANEVFTTEDQLPSSANKFPKKRTSPDSDFE